MWLAAAAAGASLAGCDRPPSPSAAKEWTTADHDKAEQRPQSGEQAPARASASPEEEAKSLGDLAWRQQCASCHGDGGRGDGPTGPMVNAPDLTRADWQGKATDDQIAHVITTGQGKMPRFSLPDRVVRALVTHVRGFRAGR
jgi:mono/diheme cytochrome c family protein